MTKSGQRALITGCSGFVGRHLARLLCDGGVAVAGFDCVQPQEAIAGASCRLGDVADRALIDEVLGEARPSWIFHLAGVLPSAPGAARACYDAHVLGTMNLLEAVHRLNIDPVVVVASSSAVYGATVSEENPISEEQPFRPLTDYATSKVAEEMVALQHWLARRVRTIRVRTFNLIGPGQSPSLLASSIAKQIAEAEARLAPASILLGNLEARRDFLDVRDAVRAYRLLAERGRPGTVYNVCRGASTSVRQCADLLTAAARVTAHITVAPDRVRQVEIPDQVGSADRLAAATGWAPEIPLERSLSDLMDDWRIRCAGVVA